MKSPKKISILIIAFVITLIIITASSCRPESEKATVYVRYKRHIDHEGGSGSNFTPEQWLLFISRTDGKRWCGMLGCHDCEILSVDKATYDAIKVGERLAKKH